MAATQRSDQGMAVAGRNYVALDQIWKAHVRQEKEASKKWPNNWTFMTTKYEDLVKDEMPRTRREKIPLPPHMQIHPVTPLNELVTVYPSSKPVPRTVSAEIGWRSSDKKLALERYGGYAKPKGGLVKQLKWPQEGII